MTRKKFMGVLVVGLFRVTVATGVMAQEAQARPSMAIADVAITPGGWTLPPPQLSGTVVELMMNELVSSERFHLYDGQWLVPEDEAGGHADLMRLRAAAEERRVDYIVLGRLTEFSSEHAKKGFGGVVPLPFIGGFSRDRSMLRVSLAFRIVEVRTGEIVASAAGEGVGRRRGRALGALVGAAQGHAARDAMLAEALRQAVHAAALELARRALPIPSGQPVPIS
jgi:curli biogenesis system outer membrane secretion channel CsgG